MEDIAAREAGAAGLQSLQNLIESLSTHPHRLPSHSAATDYIAVADVAVIKFKKFISLLDRTSTGHARFRRGPITNPPATIHKVKQTPAPEIVYSPVPVQQRMPGISLVKSGSFDRKDVHVPTTISVKGKNLVKEGLGDPTIPLELQFKT